MRSVALASRFFKVEISSRQREANLCASKLATVKCQECGLFLACGHIYALWCHPTAVCLGGSGHTPTHISSYSCSTPNAVGLNSLTSVAPSPSLPLMSVLFCRRSAELDSFSFTSLTLSSPKNTYLWFPCTCGRLERRTLIKITCEMSSAVPPVCLCNGGSNSLRNMERMRPLIYPDGLLV